MALATPPDLSDHAVPVQPLARTYPRGWYVEPHRHDWGQLLYAMSGVMWVETPREALVVPPQRAVSAAAGRGTRDTRGLGFADAQYLPAPGAGRDAGQPGAGD